MELYLTICVSQAIITITTEQVKVGSWSRVTPRSWTDQGNLRAMTSSSILASSWNVSEQINLDGLSSRLLEHIRRPTSPWLGSLHKLQLPVIRLEVIRIYRTSPAERLNLQYK